jgi:hypothetical protein
MNEVTLKLSVDNVNKILSALGQMPYQAVFELVEDMKNQVIPQIQQKPATEE